MSTPGKRTKDQPGKNCPSARDLAKFMLGQLEDAQAIAGHVGECDFCQSEIKRLEDSQRRLAEDGIPTAPARERLRRREREEPAGLAKPIKVAAGTLVVLLALLTGCAVNFAIDRVIGRDVNAFWGEFLRQGTQHDPAAPVTIVAGAAPVQVDGRVFDNYVGLGDVRGIANFFTFLQDRREAKGSVRLVSSAEVQAAPAKLGDSGGLIVIGGPGMNSSGVSLLAKAKSLTDPQDPAALKTGFRFVGLPNCRVNAFQRATTDGRIGIEDVASKQLFVCSGKESYAVVTRMNAGTRPILLVQGFDDRATELAARSMTHATRAIKDLQRVFGQRKDHAEALLRVSGDEVEVVDVPGGNPR